MENLYKITTNNYGKCMITEKDMKAGTLVAKWEGYIVDSYEEVPKNLKLYAIMIDDRRFLVPTNDCMLANHSCDPNCEVNEELEIVTLKDVKKGEELCYDYVVCDNEETNLMEWNHEWDFKCKCGSTNCRGNIDEYYYPDKM